MTDIRKLPRIASIATMPSRRESFERMLPAIRAQVHHLFVYLDGYGEVPAFLRGLDRVTVHHAEAVGDLHCASRYLCLREIRGPALVATVDDDIEYPRNYVSVLAEALHRIQGNAVVGVHAIIFLPPHESYVADALPMHFSARLDRARQVHELGAGTSAFISDRLPVDPFAWDRHDMDDILMAIEAQKRGLPRIAVPRQANWLKPIAQNQPDSLWVRTLRDHSAQDRRMRELLAMYNDPPKATGPGATPPREVPQPGRMPA